MLQVTRELEGTATPTSGAIRRSNVPGAGKELQKSPIDSIKTVHDILLYDLQKFPSNPCFGEREVVNEILETRADGKTWKYFELSGYKWMTYKEVHDRALAVGSGLIKVGLKPHSSVNIYATTSPSWMIMAHACYSQSVTISTSYDSLGEEGLAFSLNEGEVTTIFTQPDLFPVIMKISNKVPSLKVVLYSTGKNQEVAIQKVKEAMPNVLFYSLDELEALGKENPVPTTPPSPEDLCCIMYTSGSTGNPKGVMLTHGNVVAAVAGGNVQISKLVVPSETYLAYLPLAHILEFVVESCCMFTGCRLGYGNPKTLVDDSVRNCKGDIRELQPTFMAGVPAVWEKIRKGVMAKLEKASPFKQSLFWAAFNLKKRLMDYGLPHSFMDKIIFKPIQEGTGGKLKVVLSGGAPIAAETQLFLTLTICPVIQGYGMTETSGGLCMQMATDKGALGIVGSPFCCNEVKLVASPRFDPNPTNGALPQGEIWVRGYGIAKGYYKQKELTADAFTEDGWLKTGDVGEWRADGSLAVIDRIKNLVKLSNGEYVAIERLEAQYKTCKYVSMLCIVADPLKSHIISVVVANPGPMKDLFSELGVEDSDLSNEKVLKHVGAALLATGVSVNFKGADLLKKFILIKEEWTPENGMLTAAMKLQRPKIVSKYSTEIGALYVD